MQQHQRGHPEPDGQPPLPGADKNVDLPSPLPYHLEQWGLAQAGQKGTNSTPYQEAT